MFEEHLKYLSENNFETISLGEMYAILSGKSENIIKNKMVVITIDDGYHCFQDIALPLLTKYGFKATLFVYTDYINSNKNALSWQELIALSDKGFDIGSHTKSHPNLSIANNAKDEKKFLQKIEFEFKKSKEIIEKHINKPVVAIAMPYGIYDDNIRTIAKESNYKMLFTTNNCPNSETTDLFTLARFDINGNEKLQTFINKVESLPLLISNEQPSDGKFVNANDVLIEVFIENVNIDFNTLEMYIGTQKISPNVDTEKRKVFYRVLDTSRRNVYNVTLRVKEFKKNYYRYGAWQFQIKR
jgi:peptidoglycan/xylan/chitin deacetylase (PgdA/CDA1 family)